MIRKGQASLVSLVLVTATLSLVLSSLPAQTLQAEPELLQPNSTLTFDRDAIQEWANKSSWQLVYQSAKNVYTRSLLEDTKGIWTTSLTLKAKGIEEESPEMINKTIERIIAILNDRLAQYGLLGAKVTPLKDRRVEVQLPYPISPNVARGLIGRTGLLAFHKVIKSGPPGSSLSPDNLSQQVLFGRPNLEGKRRPYLVSREPLMTGRVLKNAEVRASNRPGDNVSVLLRFSDEGARKFADVITLLKPKKSRIVIVLDDVVQSTVDINNELWEEAKGTGSVGRAKIQGNFTRKEAKRLAIVFRAGVLPAEINIVRETKVEKTLTGFAFGKDTIQADATLHTPVFTWVEQNYKGELRFWSQEKINKEYEEKSIEPGVEAHFKIRIKTQDRSELKKGNLRFVLEDKQKKRWEAEIVEFSEVQTKQSDGALTYERTGDIWFNFSRGKKPSWRELTLYVIRMDKLGRNQASWFFSENGK